MRSRPGSQRPRDAPPDRPGSAAPPRHGLIPELRAQRYGDEETGRRPALSDAPWVAGLKGMAPLAICSACSRAMRAMPSCHRSGINPWAGDTESMSCPWSTWPDSTDITIQISRRIASGSKSTSAYVSNPRALEARYWLVPSRACRAMSSGSWARIPSCFHRGFRRGPLGPCVASGHQGGVGGGRACLVGLPVPPVPYPKLQASDTYTHTHIYIYI